MLVSILSIGAALLEVATVGRDMNGNMSFQARLKITSKVHF